MAWSDRKYRRGYNDARAYLNATFFGRRRHGLTDLVEEHYALSSVDEYEVGWRDFVLEQLQDVDTVWAATFLLRCSLPASSYGRLEFMVSTGQVVWRPHPFLSSIAEAFYAEGDQAQPIITVDLPARDYHVGEGVLDQ